MKTWLRWLMAGAVVLGVQTAAVANPLPVSTLSVAASGEGQALELELTTYDCTTEDVAVALDGSDVALAWTLESDEPFCWDDLEDPGEQTCLQERVYTARADCVPLGAHTVTSDLCGMPGGSLTVTVDAADPACDEEPVVDAGDGGDDGPDVVDGAPDVVGSSDGGALPPCGESDTGGHAPQTNCLPPQSGAGGDDGGAAGCNAGGGAGGPWSALALVALVALVVRRRRRAAAGA